ncbi:hypothetical protein N0V93_005923 [Gnomoniopsis smithogilvyi]|uniref:Multicopper oxidase n=1 Tax=Gnomoniopsis smithogilvyi TaxID=1191159 RepID=A0A9W9CXL1_9PEZI|nr:hypothetical protein N0V93_005923 [Gnomoniopsis smithogilvyi]
MANNGSSIHWHGVRQNWTNAWDGIFGGILINGPATANYDVDLGHVFLNDWSHQTADVLALAAATTGPPTLDNCLINGTNTWTEDDGTVVGSRFETTFVSDTKYRIRLVNGAADTHFRFTIDNHTMEVISTDFVPITPYNTTNLSIGMGQRYDVIVTALSGETTGNFWIRAIPQEACSDNDNVDNILGIIRYDSSSTEDPTTTEYADLVDSCDDEDPSDLAPYLAIDVGTVEAEDDEDAGLTVTTTIKWTMNNISFLSEWDYPTVMAIAEGNNSWTTGEHVWALPTADEWVMMIIQTELAQAHPIHLHGHDFWVLGAGDGAYNSSDTTLQTVNAPRRDVAMLPGDGWLALAWITDNPGAWVMHCHIAWHTDEGFALQLVERESEINATQNNTYIDETCSSWDAYVSADDIVQDDSGI